MTAPIHLIVESAIATVTIDRPPVNAVDFASYGELRRVFQQITDDRGIRVAVLARAVSV